MRRSASHGLSALAGLLVVATIGTVVLWTLQRRLIYFPLPGVPPPAAVGLPSAQEVSFATADGLTLNGWFVPPTARGLAMTAIVFNGNAGHRGFRAPLAIMLADAGVATLLFDYRGYGENEGEPSEDGLAADATAAYRYVVSRKDVAADRVVYFGESLGAAVAVRLATEHAPRALILRSPFTSLLDVGRHHYPILPVATLLRERYASIDRIGRITCPVLVIAAARDSIVPFEQSRRLYEAAPSPKHLVVIDGVDHNDYELAAGQRMKAEILQFLRPLAS
jgi:uncharacterized protein